MSISWLFTNYANSPSIHTKSCSSLEAVDSHRAFGILEKLFVDLNRSKCPKMKLEDETEWYLRAARAVWGSWAVLPHTQSSSFRKAKEDLAGSLAQTLYCFTANSARHAIKTQLNVDISWCVEEAFWQRLPASESECKLYSSGLKRFVRVLREKEKKRSELHSQIRFSDI